MNIPLKNIIHALHPSLRDRARGPLIEVTSKIIGGRVKSYTKFAEDTSSEFYSYDRRRKFEFDEPVYHGNLPVEIAKLIGRHERPRPFVLTACDMYVCGREGYVISPDGTYLVFDYGRTESGDVARSVAASFVIGLSHGSVPPMHRPMTHSCVKLDCAVSLLSLHDTNYTHWVQEALTSLEGIQQVTKAYDLVPTIVIPPDPPEFVISSLVALGIAPNQIYEWDGKPLVVKKLLLPSLRRFLSSTSNDYVRSPEAFDWVKNRVLSYYKLKTHNSRRLLISREDAESRRMTNRQEVLCALKNLGFELIAPGELTYKQQVRAFSEAEIIIGVHGAGLINAIYSADSLVIEIFADHYLPANYELAMGQNRDYACFEAQQIGPDIYVEVPELTQFIRGILDSS
jgi:capsular polysaccharide biosynthesis protein